MPWLSVGDPDLSGLGCSLSVGILLQRQNLSTPVRILFWV